MMEKCNVNDEDGGTSFYCRSFVVRYRDEIFDLNDAVHWRLTIPRVIFLFFIHFLIPFIFAICICSLLYVICR